MMNPAPPMGPSGPSPVGGGLKPGSGQAPAPAEIEGQLKMLLAKAKEMAEANGLDWNKLVAGVGGGGERPSSAPPVPNAPPM